MANKYRIKPGPPTLTPSSRSEDEQVLHFLCIVFRVCQAGQVQASLRDGPAHHGEETQQQIHRQFLPVHPQEHA